MGLTLNLSFLEGAGLNTFTALVTNAPVSALLLGTFVSVSVLGLWTVPALLDRHLLRPYWLLRRRQYATLVTSGFIHADLIHLAFNAFTFFAFAFTLERRIGAANLAALYATGLLVSSAGTWLQHRHDAGYASLGASGAILAVLFASIVYFPEHAIYILPIPVPIPAPLFALAYLAFSYVAARRGGGRVNHDAHLSGALAGVAFVALTDMPVLISALQRAQALLG